MAKIIQFPGSPGSRPGFGNTPGNRGFSDESADDWEDHVVISRWWRLGRDILASIPPSGFLLAEDGSLPGELVRQLHSIHIKPWLDRFSRPVGTESDSRDISLVHWMLGQLKLVKVLKGRLTLTRSGQELAEDAAELFPLFFDLSISGIHWDSSADKIFGDYLQTLVPSSLALIADHCEDWISCNELIAIADSDLGLPAAADKPSELWYHATVRAWAEPLGLVELQEPQTELRRWDLRDEELRITPLFTSFLK